MANPNIVNVTSILGATDQTSLTTTAATQILENAAASGTVIKVNTIIVCNEDGSNACDFSLLLYSEDALGGTGEPLCSTISVPADATLIAIDKNASFYLTEDKSLGAIAGTANDLVVTVSYETIS